MTESTPTADCKTSIQPYLRQAERGHQKGPPKFRGVSSVPRRLSLHGPAPPPKGPPGTVDTSPLYY